MQKVKVVLVKSLIGAKPNQVKTADSLGLRKIGDSNIVANDAVLAGDKALCERNLYVFHSSYLP